MKKFINLILFVVLCTSCSIDENISTNNTKESKDPIELSLNEYASIAFDSPNELTKDQAVKILVDFLDSEQKRSSTRTKDMPFIELVKKEFLHFDRGYVDTRTTPDKDGGIQTPIYVF